ncbi:MAG TPA: tRNA 2-selenouridine(34) synthase MnmH [Firmicutes bacterium]|nr:tRNA 2-selenouridine(34) synthase MnmH [Bacillota bacterium]
MAAGIEVREALNRTDLIFIDVRSPGEFSRESIPGAINIPLFTDDQQRRLGIIYKTEGEPAARRAGLNFISPRLPEIVDSVCKAAGDKTPLLYCWRGGTRSLSLFQILGMLKIPALRLKGGYRAYRKYVYQILSCYRIKPEAVVLNGLTGVGKTAIIKQLLLQGYPAIDLEGLAHHRGSVFGAVGFTGRRSQKDFESLLLIELNKFQTSPFLVLEGEGSRIGHLHLPRFLTQAMREGVHVLINAPLFLRAERILQEYLSPGLSAENLSQIKQGLLSLEHRLGKTRTTRLLNLLQEGDYHTVVQELCSSYYDRLYEDAKPEHQEFITIIEANQINQATTKLIKFLNRRYLESYLPQKEDVLT